VKILLSHIFFLKKTKEACQEGKPQDSYIYIERKSNIVQRDERQHQNPSKANQI
jgi:hypothetical protein